MANTASARRQRMAEAYGAAMFTPEPTPTPTPEEVTTALARALAALIEVLHRPPASPPPSPLTVVTAGDGRRLYSVKEAARLLSLSAGGLNSLIYAGGLLSVKLGGRRLIPAEELDRYIEERMSEARAAVARGQVPGL